MNTVVKSLLIVLPIGLASVVGCAVGDPADDIDDDELVVTRPKEAGAEDSGGSVTLPPPSDPPVDDDDDDDDDTLADAGAPDSGGGTDAGTGDAGTGDPGTGPANCVAPNVCASSSNGAVHLGSVSGDKGADTVTTKGYTSKWFTVRVTEDDSGLIGAELWMTATLFSPPGTNFDLYVYVPSSDSRECSNVTGKSTNTTNTDKVAVRFGESGAFSNGKDDDRTVTVEVRHVSGTCSAGDEWALLIEGNK